VIHPRPQDILMAVAGRMSAAPHDQRECSSDEGSPRYSATAPGRSCPPSDSVFLYNERFAHCWARAQIPLIVPATSKGGGFMAGGYAPPGRVGGVPGHLRPGATTLFTGVAIVLYSVPYCS